MIIFLFFDLQIVYNYYYMGVDKCDTKKTLCLSNKKL
jgi:hypothetical protein